MDKEKKYKYSTESCYANGYSSDVVFGSKLGSVIIATSGRSDWGAGGGSMSFGEGPMTLPDTIDMYYYSLPENQFWKLNASLPKERIKEIFEKSYPDLRGGTNMNYIGFTVGIAPCGYVAVWVVGSAGAILLDTLRAEKTIMNYNKAFPDRQWNQQKAFTEKSVDLFGFIQDEMHTNTLSSKYWEDLNKKYKWKLEFDDPGLNLYNFSAATINVEDWTIESDEGRLMSSAEKAIPAELVLLFKHDKDPIRYKICLTFEPAVMGYDPDANEEQQVLRHMERNKELMRLFEYFYKEAGEEEVSLLLDLNEEMTELKVYLKTDNLKMEIPGCKIEIFSSDKWKL